MTWSAVARETGASVSSLLRWSADPDAYRRRRRRCPRCGTAPLDSAAYAALLGYYLGDGHLSSGRRDYVTLRITCDNRYPGIISDVAACIMAVRPDGRLSHPRRDGCINVQSQWQHWPCLFPQHGPGRKHERPIVLESWQRATIEDQPGPFLRGLFHSDGARVRNWARRRVGGELKTYHYPRWQFCNASEDILRLCTDTLDASQIAWRRSNVRIISVSTRGAVARLDTLIGPKT